MPVKKNTDIRKLLTKKEVVLNSEKMMYNWIDNYQKVCYNK